MKTESTNTEFWLHRLLITRSEGRLETFSEFYIISIFLQNFSKQKPSQNLLKDTSWISSMWKGFSEASQRSILPFQKNLDMELFVRDLLNVFSKEAPLKSFWKLLLKLFSIPVRFVKNSQLINSFSHVTLIFKGAEYSTSLFPSGV